MYAQTQKIGLVDGLECFCPLIHLKRETVDGLVDGLVCKKTRETAIGLVVVLVVKLSRLRGIMRYYDLNVDLKIIEMKINKHYELPICRLSIK